MIILRNNQLLFLTECFRLVCHNPVDTWHSTWKDIHTRRMLRYSQHFTKWNDWMTMSPTCSDIWLLVTIVALLGYTEKTWPGWRKFIKGQGLWFKVLQWHIISILCVPFVLVVLETCLLFSISAYKPLSASESCYSSGIISSTNIASVHCLIHDSLS